MPLYNNSFELDCRRRKCNSELKRLLDILESEEYRRYLRPDIEGYFAHYFNKTTNVEEGIAVVEQYEHFITMVSEVQQGLLSREDAFNKINEETEDKKFAIIADNILKVCEILFWSTVGVLAYGACLSIGGAISVINPFVGIGAMVGLFLVFIAALDNAVECFDEFKTFDPVEKLSVMEKQYVTFFKAEPSKDSKSFMQTDEDEQDETLALYKGMVHG